MSSLSQRLDKYRRKTTEVNNNNNNKIDLTPVEAPSPQQTQELFKDWFKCICYRPNAFIVCVTPNCPYRAYGRVRRLCRLHPNVTYLLDLPSCPMCRAKVEEMSPT